LTLAPLLTTSSQYYSLVSAEEYVPFGCLATAIKAHVC
jgi:hypothetical protein